MLGHEGPWARQAHRVAIDMIYLTYIECDNSTDLVDTGGPGGVVGGGVP